MKREKNKETEKQEVPQKQKPLEIPPVTPLEIPEKQQEETEENQPKADREVKFENN